MSKQEKIICLGKEFNSEEERFVYYHNELPALKKIDGLCMGKERNKVRIIIK
jgi:hypothetical protein